MQSSQWPPALRRRQILTLTVETPIATNVNARADRKDLHPGAVALEDCRRTLLPTSFSNANPSLHWTKPSPSSFWRFHCAKKNWKRRGQIKRKHKRRGRSSSGASPPNRKKDKTKGKEKKKKKKEKKRRGKRKVKFFLVESFSYFYFLLLVWVVVIWVKKKKGEKERNKRKEKEREQKC